ncbi:hypothetical protein FOT61_19825 [Serratia marcescens]|uniref:hypothetical protein n=1 Tax=Serratia marcescens TaxID=615 RepID=UPI0011CA1051|nr:hypothetical protein [Serratia marcescens]TXE35675.1 hypothetical protein FOT61_19825 [Serratia marcescens]
MYSHYPAHYTFDSNSDAWQIGFHDFPEWQSACYKCEDIELEAQESLLAAIAAAMDEGLPLPAPSPLQTDDLRVHLPALVTLKIELHNAMLRKNTGKAALARKLGFNGGQMERLLDIGYASKIEALEQALYLLGYEVRVTISEVCQ